MLIVVSPDKLLRCDLDPQKEFIEDPTEQKFNPEAVKTLSFLARTGHKIVLISNQGGCEAINPSTGAPYRSLDDAFLLEQWTLCGNPYLLGSFICPSLKGDHCYWLERDKAPMLYNRVASPLPYRKPSPGMLFLAMKKFQETCDNTISLGVFPEDEAAAKFMGLKHFSSLEEFNA